MLDKQPLASTLSAEQETFQRTACIAEMEAFQNSRNQIGERLFAGSGIDQIEYDAPPIQFFQGGKSIWHERDLITGAGEDFLDPLRLTQNIQHILRRVGRNLVM